MSFDWKKDLTEWAKTKRKIKSLSQELIIFFELAFDNLAEIGFNNTNVREKAWFGTHKTRTSLVIGPLFWAACHLQDKDGKTGIYLITDEEFPDANFIFSPVDWTTKKYTRLDNEPLYWLYAPNFEDVRKINSQSDIWQSYKKASGKVFQFQRASADVDSKQIKCGKVRVSDFWTKNTLNYDSFEQIERNFENEVNKSFKLSKSERLERLLTAPKKPTSNIAIQKVFNRNPNVVSFVLERANGFCENCKKIAPFKRKDGTPYLEVHHKIRLADNGDDTVENAIALCPNCHRETHYGNLIL